MLVQDPIPINLRSLGKVKSMACGLSHTVLLAESGLVFTVGDNSFGQLGVPFTQQ